MQQAETGAAPLGGSGVRVDRSTLASARAPSGNTVPIRLQYRPGGEAVFDESSELPQFAGWGARDWPALVFEVPDRAGRRPSGRQQAALRDSGTTRQWHHRAVAPQGGGTTGRWHHEANPRSDQAQGIGGRATEGRPNRPAVFAEHWRFASGAPSTQPFDRGQRGPRILGLR